jgi:uncharacterized repeat protein (TIGR03806 family)
MRFIYAVALCTACTIARGDAPTVQVDINAEKPPKLISAYNLFKDNANQVPNDRVIPYDLNTPLFSDYAAKHRFVWMPNGTSAKYDGKEAFDFPVGTVLIKSFSFLRDIRDPSKGERIVETRLLIHKPKGWVGLPYLWKEDMSDAELKIAGKQVDVTWTHYDGKERTNKYIVPNTNQCMACHENAKKMQPIGPKARHLNREYTYSDGSENQLARWAKLDYLSGAPTPDKCPKAPVWDDPKSGSLDSRARIWLDINCAHCHNPKGSAHPSGLDLSIFQTDPYRIGVNKTPVAAGRGAGGYFHAIEPGKPDESIMVFRIESTDPGIMMPQLPRKLVDEEGVSLIKEWIAGMK